MLVQPRIYGGYVKKKKSSTSSTLTGKTNLRWLEIHYAKGLFGYKGFKSDHSFTKSHKFNEIVEVRETITAADKTTCSWKFGFQILTKSKKYVFYVQSEDQQTQWAKVFTSILKKEEGKLK